MARKMYVSSEMGVDPKLLDVSERDPLAAMLWPWLITQFDDWGRGEADARKLKHTLFPVNDLITTEVIDRALTAFHDVDLLRLYVVDSRRYMTIEPDRWWRWQTHVRGDKRTNDASRLPLPPVNNSDGPPVDRAAPVQQTEQQDIPKQHREQPESGSARDPVQTHANARSSTQKTASLPPSLPPSPTARSSVQSPADPDSAVTAAIEILVQRDWAAAKKHPDPKKRPRHEGWRDTARATIAGRHTIALIELVDTHPDWTPTRLADAVDPQAPVEVTGNLPAWQPRIVDGALDNKGQAAAAHTTRARLAHPPKDPA